MQENKKWVERLFVRYFEIITRQKKSLNIELNEFKNLFDSNIVDIIKPIRLLGIGFRLNDKKEESSQYDIFNR